MYHALESDNPVVLEKALKVVPGLCESLDYTVRFHNSPLHLIFRAGGDSRRGYTDGETNFIPQNHDGF